MLDDSMSDPDIIITTHQYRALKENQQLVVSLKKTINQLESQIDQYRMNTNKWKKKENYYLKQIKQLSLNSLKLSRKIMFEEENQIKNQEKWLERERELLEQIKQITELHQQLTNRLEKQHKNIILLNEQENHLKNELREKDSLLKVREQQWKEDREMMKGTIQELKEQIEEHISSIKELLQGEEKLKELKDDMQKQLSIKQTELKTKENEYTIMNQQRQQLLILKDTLNHKLSQQEESHIVQIQTLGQRLQLLTQKLRIYRKLVTKMTEVINNLKSEITCLKNQMKSYVFIFTEEMNENNMKLQQRLFHFNQNDFHWLKIQYKSLQQAFSKSQEVRKEMAEKYVKMKKEVEKKNNEIKEQKELNNDMNESFKRNIEEVEYLRKKNYEFIEQFKKIKIELKMKEEHINRLTGEIITTQEKSQLAERRVARLNEQLEQIQKSRILQSEKTDKIELQSFIRNSKRLSVKESDAKWIEELGHQLLNYLSNRRLNIQDDGMMEHKAQILNCEFKIIIKKFSNMFRDWMQTQK